MDISLIAALIIALYAMLFALVHMLKARKRSWIMAVVSLGVTLFSAIVAIPLTHWLAEFAVERSYDYFNNYFVPALAAYLESVPVGAEGLRVLISLVATPLLFVPVFLLLRLILSIVMKIVETCVPSLTRRTLRGVSMPVGAINGLLIAVVTLIPLCGYVTLCVHLLDTASETGLLEEPMVQEALPEGILDDVDYLYEVVGCHPVVTGIHNTVGEPLFTALTTTRLQSKYTHGHAVKMNLEQEVTGVMITASHALDAADAVQTGFAEEDKAALFATADSFFESDWIRMVAADSLVALSESWLANRSFAGVSRPALDANLNPTVNKLLEILSTETSDTLEEDIHVILDVVGDLMVYDLLQSDGNYTDMVERMSQSGLLTDMLEKLEANERLSALAGEMKALAIRLVTNMLGVDKLQSGEYSDMMGGVASTLTDALSLSEAERDELILSSVKEHFAEQGFDIPDEVTLKMSHHMIEELGADGVITEEELTQYMVDHAEDGFDIIGGEAIPNGDSQTQP